VGVLSCSRDNVTGLHAAHRPPSRLRSAFMSFPSSAFPELPSCSREKAPLAHGRKPLFQEVAARRRFGPGLFFGLRTFGPRDASAAAAAISEASTFPEAPIQTSVRWPASSREPLPIPAALPGITNGGSSAFGRIRSIHPGTRTSLAGSSFARSRPATGRTHAIVVPVTYMLSPHVKLACDSECTTVHT
jgi:hypothetical protein